MVSTIEAIAREGHWYKANIVVLEQERIPFNEGFVTPYTAVVGTDIANMIAKVQEAAVVVGMSTIPDRYP